MFSQFTQWLLDLVKTVFKAAWDFIVDAVIWIVDGILGALVAIFNAIPVPDFLANGIQSVYGQLDPGVLFVLGNSGIPEGLSIIGMGYAFRMARKAATLFQW